MGETCRQLKMRGYSEWYADIDEQLGMLGGGFRLNLVLEGKIGLELVQLTGRKEVAPTGWRCSCGRIPPDSEVAVRLIPLAKE